MVIDESRLDSLSEDGSIEVKNVVLEQENTSNFLAQVPQIMTNLKIPGKN